VLFGGLTTVAAFLVISLLYPGKKARLFEYGVTNDRFVLAIEKTAKWNLKSLAGELKGAMSKRWIYELPVCRNRCPLYSCGL